MRTKVNKNFKKAAQQKLSINLASPKVVLNANDCARLLDGTGKTSVLLVEKAGKIVPATSTTLTQSLPTSSLSSLPSGSSVCLSAAGSSSSSIVTTYQTNLCKSSANLTSAKSTKSAEILDSAQTERPNIANPNNSPEDHNKSIETKVILKPPKKRRGMDKKFEDTSPVAQIFNNGDVSHSTISSTGELPGSHSVQTDADVSSLILPALGDISKLHSIEHLLQHQSKSLVTLSSSKTLIPGGCTNNSVKLILSQSDMLSSSLTPVSMILPASSSAASDDYSDSTQHCVSQLYSHSCSATSQPLDNCSFSCQISHCELFGKAITREQSPSLHLPRSLSTNIVTCSEHICQLPEQVEPMNLSTSCKPAIELPSFQASIKTDNQMSDNASQHSQPQQITPTVCHIPEVHQAKEAEVKEPENQPCRSQTALLHASRPSERQRGNHPVRIGVADAGTLMKRNDPEVCRIFKQPETLVCSNSLPDSVILSFDINSQAEEITSVQLGETEILFVEHKILSSTPPTVISQSPHTTTLKASVSHISSSVDSQTGNVSKDTNNLPDSCVEPPIVNEQEATPKAKKPPKKRVEIPMDEVSRADRIHRYSLTIDDVIANFVFIPEPVEEFLLTEEEEAAIRDQFENINNISNSENADINCLQKSSDASSTNKDPSVLKMEPEKSSIVLEKSPQKCLNALTAEKHTFDECQHLQTTVDNIDSVLAFVAGDVSSSAPPVSSYIEDTDSKKYKKVVRKFKQTAEFMKISTKGQKALKISSIINKHDSSKNMCILKKLDSAKEQIDVPTSANGKSIEDNESTPRPKKVKKRKSDTEATKSTTLVHSPPVVQIATVTSTTDEELPAKLMSPANKKKTEGKLKVTQKRKSESKQKIVYADSSVTSLAGFSGDKEIVGSSRAETSDIGESIASTSGGSEQDTPVHEPEPKDEMVSTDPQVTDLENNDTGLESEEDDSKPVRRYKKRLNFVKCDHCDHQARGRSALSRHMKKVHMLDVNMPYRCEHCDYGCTKMASLNRHLFTHGVYSCSRCSFVTDERIKLTQHVIEQHKDKLNMKLCKMCNRYIKCDHITIEQHVQECQGPTPFKCTECEKEFKYASSLRVHYHTHFPNQPKRFKCEHCDYRTNYKANLHKHHKNMHASRDRDVQCPECGKLFSTEDNMRRHRKVHTSVRPFACETCEKTFKTSGALRGHQLIHTATRPYICNIPGCNRSFRTPKFMKSHQEEFHRLVPKKFFCSVEGCSFSFFKRSHLKRHAITHTGERNFHCTWPGCRKSFRHADNLKVHFRSHTNEKPVQCHLCDFTCKQKNSLFWHKKKIHQIIDVLVCPKHTEYKLKLTETENVSKKATISVKAEDKTCQVLTTVTEKMVPGLKSEALNEADKKAENVPIKDVSLDSSEQERSAPCEHSVGTQTLLQQAGQTPLDLYEFKSDDESEEETPGHFRRDKAVMNVLMPLPPPPKELLYKIEVQEMKEKEKKEKFERKEQEKKEKAEKRDQEKKEKAEKKNLEKKDKMERKEIEKQEKIIKKEQEKKEKLEKKELQKKEKVEMKELEKKEKEEKKELEKKEKEAKKEQERNEKLIKKEQEKKEQLERKEREKRERTERKEQGKKEKTEKKPTIDKLKKTETMTSLGEEIRSENIETKKCPKILKRKKVQGTKEEFFTDTDKPRRSKKLKLNGSDLLKCEKYHHKTKESNDVAARMPKRKIIATKKAVESYSATSSRLPATAKNVVDQVKKKSRLPPPKRKPSARIMAKKKATAEKTKAIGKVKKTCKAVLKKKNDKKKVVPKLQELKEVKQDNAVGTKSKTCYETKTDDETNAGDDNSIEKLDKKEVPLKPSQEENVVPPFRPSSPAYSEEIMLQGKASPYRGFSEAENLEDEEPDVEKKTQEPPSSPSQSQPKSPNVQDKFELEADLQSFEKVENCAMDRHLSQPVDEYSDNEVSNDIPLTPPRAPAPPPVESSEDEMEPDPEPTPFSVPGPHTPFSVPEPNTPFSVPPPTSLLQQHSVHSEEAPMSALPSVPSMELHSQGSLDVQQPLGSVELHPHGSVEMNHPHGSVEMNHPHGSVEMNHPHGSVEMNHSQGSVEMNHSQGSVEMSHSHSAMEVRSHNSVEMRSNGSVEMMQPLGSMEIPHPHRSVSTSLSHSEQNISSIRTPESVIRDCSSNSMSDKYDLPQSLQDQAQASDADKEYFDQYLKSLSAANNRAANSGLGPSPSGLQQLEAMVCKSHHDSREMSSRSPISSLPISVITSLESTLSLLQHGDLRSRMDVVVSDRHHEALYVRDTPSSLPRLPDRQTPLPPSHPCSTPSFETFSLNPLHPAAAGGGRENCYLRQSEKLFPASPSTSSFMAEAIFQRQAMTTPFLQPQPTDKTSLSRMPDTAPLRSSSSSSFLQRPGTVPSADMFSPPAMTRAIPRHPFANAWASQEVRPAHWQTHYLPRQPNMAATSSFFQTKDNYLAGRNFMFDPTVRPAVERNMFPSLSSSQSQDSFQLDRFDLSSYFPNAMAPYGSSTGSLDYSRSAHSASTKPFDDRYRQTSATSASISDFRGLPASGGSSDMFSGLPGVNTGFSIYPGNPMSYHSQHISDNVNSAFLAHPASTQHAMFERDYAAAAAHRGLYPQNPSYSFIDDRQYPGASKLGHTHPVPTTPVPQERDIMSRSASTDNQMQDPYRSMLYRY